MTPHRSAPRRIAFAKGAAFVLALVSAASLAAEDLTPAFVAEHGDLLVSRVAYEGNKRTKNSVIDEIVDIRPGMRVSELDPEAAKQALLKAGIFSDASLSAEVEDSGVAVTVRVVEKWTFLPLPSGSWGSGGWSAALFLVDFNFLGLRKTAVLELSDSNLGWSGLAAYSDPRFLGSKTSFRAFADYENEEETAEYMDKSTYADFHETRADGGLSVQYPSEGELQGELDLTARYYQVGAAEAASYGLYEDSLAIQAEATVNYDGQTVVGYRKIGPFASGTYEHSFALSGMPAFDLVTASAEWDAKTFLDGCLEAGASARASSGSFQSLSTLSGPGYRTLPYGASYSPEAATAFAALALPIKLGWCAMELGPFYEAGIYRTGVDADKVDLFQGPGLLYRLYLRDIDLPAVEIAVAYNLPASVFAFSVNVGLSM